MTDQKTSTDWNNHFCCVLCRITKTFAISWQCKKVPLGRILVFSTTFQPPPKRLNYDIWHRAIWDFCESNNDLPIRCGDQASLNLRYLKNNNLYLWCNVTYRLRAMLIRLIPASVRSNLKSILKNLFCCIFFLKNGPTPASFLFILGLFQANIITIFTTNICEKNSIEYMVPGFKPMTFRMWISTHNH